MRNYLFGLLIAALALSCQTATAQAGGITKNGKTQSWKFADNIPASTVTLFPSFAQATATDSVQSVHAYQEYKYDTLATAYTTLKVTAPTYFKGGERLLLTLPVSDTSKRVVVYQTAVNYRDTIQAATRQKSVEFFYDQTKYKLLSK